MTFNLNRAAEAKLLDPISPSLGEAVAATMKLHPPVQDGVTRTYNPCYSIIVRKNGSIEYGAKPVLMSGSARFNIWVQIDGAGGDVERNYWRFDVPLVHLTELPKRYSLYQVRFCVSSPGKRDLPPAGHGPAIEINQLRDSDANILLEKEDLGPLGAGYIGITKRSPFARFNEHWRNAMRGGGHLLHRTWNSLARSDAQFHVAFQFCGSQATLEQAYAAEEAFVDQLTLAPKGLNAIPGGMAGIRMMHELRLVSGTRQIGLEERDRGLVKLEVQAGQRGSPCAHYRTGHLRRLPDNRLTFVRPCWVNPDRVAA